MWMHTALPFILLFPKRAFSTVLTHLYSWVAHLASAQLEPVLVCSSHIMCAYSFDQPVPSTKASLSHDHEEAMLMQVERFKPRVDEVPRLTLQLTQATIRSTLMITEHFIRTEQVKQG